MPSPTPPTSDDVNAQLVSAGETVGAVDTERILAAVIEEWSRRAGWAPFQAIGDADTRYYGISQGGLVMLPGYATIASVKTGVTYNSTTGEPEGGTVSVRNVGYRPIYWRDGDTNTPVTWLELSGCYGASRSMVSVTGQVGYSLELPDDVWQAWVDGAASRAMASTSITRTKGIKKMTIGGRTIEFADGLPVTWAASFDSSINAYRRGGVA